MAAERSGGDGVEAVAAAYGGFGEVLREVDEAGSWEPTGCTGWAVRDLVFHCLEDVRRGLVALHTPAQAPPDRDAVSYWRDWAPGTAGAANGRRWARVSASMFLGFGQLRDLYLETAAALVVAARRADPCCRVATQGHVLTADDLLATLAVEATVHHLDLLVGLPDAPGPSPRGLACVRRTLDGLLGGRPPVGWDDVHYARAATGRVALTGAEREALGADADRFPLFG